MVGLKRSLTLEHVLEQTYARRSRWTDILHHEPSILEACEDAHHSSTVGRNLGVGAIEKRAKVVTLPDGTDTIAIKSCGYMTLGFDHRVIDGAVADQFMSDVKAALEHFDESAM